MTTAQIDFDLIKIKAKGHCFGGDHPDPPLDSFPLLAWTKNHPIHGYMVVHTEDQKASVQQIALALCETPDYAAVASKFNTSVDHVDQAARYALKAVCLS